MIATGTKPARPPGVEFDEDRVLDSDGILDLKIAPGVDGRGRRRRDRHRVRVDVRRAGHQGHGRREARLMLDFCDPEIVEALRFHLRDLAVTFRFGEEVTAVDVGAAGTVTTLASGKQIPAETVMYSAGRQGADRSPGPRQRRAGSRQPRPHLRRRPVPAPRSTTSTRSAT